MFSSRFLFVLCYRRSTHIIPTHIAKEGTGREVKITKKPEKTTKNETFLKINVLALLNTDNYTFQARYQDFFFQFQEKPLWQKNSLWSEFSINWSGFDSMTHINNTFQFTFFLFNESVEGSLQPFYSNVSSSYKCYAPKCNQIKEEVRITKG